MSLHLTYLTDMAVRDRLDRWDTLVRAHQVEAPNWRLQVVWNSARDASISGSTGIEGNPLDLDEVEAVLAGSAVVADDRHVLEVENYNAALDLARAAISRPDFAWTHEIIHQVNATVMRGLPRDTQGNYRATVDDEVQVGVFTGPSPLLVQGLMSELVEWLRASTRMSTVVRSALVHLNVIAIHPFNDGNGRTARILASMTLMEDGIRSPELISIETYLRRNRDEYVAALRLTLGAAYDPDSHPVTEWLDYYTRISLERLELRNVVLEALPSDAGTIYAALADAGDPLGWTTTLLAARVGRIRTASWALATGMSQPATRAQLAQMAEAGWLNAYGRTRGRWYGPAERLDALPLRVPTLMGRLTQGRAASDQDD